MYQYYTKICDKNLQDAFFQMGSKAAGPMLQDFTAR
jgi:hypothetical protein